MFVVIGDLVRNTIDFRLSKENGRTEIRQGASPKLDELKSMFSQIVEVMPDIKDYMLTELQVPKEVAQHIRHCTILSGLGFLVAVALEPESGEVTYLGRNGTEDVWDVKFIDQDVAYCKNSFLLHLDSQYGDLPSQISGE